MDIAPQLTPPQLQELMDAFQNINSYTQSWSAYQISEISTRNSLIVEKEFLKQKSFCSTFVLKLSDETIEEMIEYTKKIKPDICMDEIMGQIRGVEQIGTACIRYLTLDQYNQFRVQVISAFSDNAETTTTTTRAPTTTENSSSEEHHPKK